MKLPLLPFVLALIFNHLLDLKAVSYYVSPNGSDSNNGTSSVTPFKTLQKAANISLPGDIVYAMNGTFTNSCPTCDVLQVNRSGSSSAYITFKAFPGHTPKIVFNSWQGIKIFGASYIRIEGFEIIGNNQNITLSFAQSEKSNVNQPLTSGNGIYIENNGSNFPHHIIITQNSIHDCGGHGIGSHWTDYVTIEKNTIYNNAWYSPLGCSGISLYQNRNYDTGTGTRIFINSNKIYNNQMFIPFFYNGKIEDGNAMIIDDGRNTQNASPYGKYNGKIRIENNLTFDNGGKGIHAYYSDNIEVLNNTCFQNCKSPEVKDGELSAYACSNVTFYNNATYSRSDARANHDGDGTSSNIIFNYNSYFNYNTSKKITKGSNDIIADPKFVNATTNSALADFHLQPTSPLINKGTSSLAPTMDYSGLSRPQSLLHDIGAYEYLLTPSPNKAPSVVLVSPTQNSTFTSGATILLAAEASDADGTIAKVEFYKGSTKIGEDLTSPYTCNVLNATEGVYTFTAKAFDDKSLSTTSGTISVTVSGPTIPPATTLCNTQPVPNATSWNVLNNWNDQSNGSGVSNSTEALRISHRAWGNNYLWVLEKNAAINVVAGKEYIFTFDFLNDAANPVISIEAAFVKSNDPSTVLLLQPTAQVSGFSASAYSKKSVVFKAAATGVIKSGFKFNWSGQPNNQVNSYLKNISICEKSSSAIREGAEELTEISVNIYPNPTRQTSVLSLSGNTGEKYTVEGFDAQGALRFTEELTGYGEVFIGGEVKAGMYILKITGNSGSRSFKWIKE